MIDHLGFPVSDYERAKAFYLSRAEFIEHPAQSRTLFLPIETLIAALV